MNLIELAKQTATQQGLDPALVCAVVEQESSWEPWAIRYEPAFQRRYVEPLNLGPTETTARSISWGLLQIIGQVARELGFKGKMASLCDPAVGLEWGCRHLKNCLNKADGNVYHALLRWNGGGNPSYPDEVLARIKKFQS